MSKFRLSRDVAFAVGKQTRREGGVKMKLTATHGSMPLVQVTKSG
jgi:hypothetical protein